MPNYNLPVFSIANSSPSISIPNVETQHLQTHRTKPLEPSGKSLQGIFPQNREENVVTKTRHILGEKAKTLSDEQIQYAVTEFQYLINAWLDEFEKDVFNGITLKELLNDK